MADVLELPGRRALVAGGSRGIGAAVSARLARLGAHVCILYSRDDRAAEATRDAIVARGGSAEIVKANLLNPDDVRDAIGRMSAGGRIDALVHAAALGSFKPTIDVKPSQWDLTMGVGARSLLVAAQAAVPAMPRGASIVSLSSLGGARVMPGYGAIGVAKAALESLTRYLACELAPKGIRVNAVAAGLIEGTSIASHPAFARVREETLRRTPAGRLGTVDDVADAVVFLCSPLSSWIVGQTLVVDGGMSLGL